MKPPKIASFSSRLTPFASRRIGRSILVASIAGLVGAHVASAQISWDAEALDGLWSSGTNWSTNVEPSITDAVIFPLTLPSTITLSSGEQALSLNFQDSYVLTGGDLTLGAATSITVDPTLIATVNSVLSGAGTTLTKNGNGTLILGGANTYAGRTVIGGGVLQISADNNLGAVPGAAVANQLEFLTGGTLRATGTVSTPQNRGVTVTGTSTIDVGLGDSLSVDGVIAGAGTLTKTGAGSLTITRDPSKSGTTNIDGGVLILNHSGAIDFNTVINNGGTLRTLTAAVGDTADVTINAGGVFEMNSASDTMGGLAGAGLVTRSVTGAATLTLQNGNESTAFSGVIEDGSAGGTLAITKNGSGTLTLTGANTFTGALTIPTGTVIVNGPDGAVSGATSVAVGDNNGGGETLIVGSVDNVVSVALNRLADNTTLNLRGSQGATATAGGFTYAGPAVGSATNEERIGSINFNEGRNTITLLPGTGNDVQLTVTNALTRASSGTALIRGANLGQTGAGSARLKFETLTGLLSGGGGADGSTTISISPFLVGDASPSGAGTGFLTHGTNGLRLLEASEYDASIAGATQSRNVNTTGGETIVSDTAINALLLSSAGSTTVSNASLRVESGAVLFTANSSIDGSGSVSFPGQGIIHAAANTTAITGAINTRIRGVSGVAIGSTGDVFNTVSLGGDNTLIGTVVGNGGNIRLTSAGGFNADIKVDYTARPASVLQLNDNDLTVRNLSGVTGAFIENGGTTDKTLAVFNTGAQTFNGVLRDGSTGKLGLVVSTGANTFTLGQNNLYTGATEIRSGVLQLQGNNVGYIRNSLSVSALGGTLRLRNTSGNLLSDRIANGGTVFLNSGTFHFDHNAGAINYSETDGGVLNLAGGGNSIIIDQAATGQTSLMTFDSLTRQAGATLNLTSFAGDGALVSNFGTNNQGRLTFTAAPSQINGILGGWATVDTAANTREFAKYVPSGTISLTALVAGDYTPTLSSGDNSAQNVKLTSSPAALGSDTQINSLNLAQASAVAIDMGGNRLRLQSGGVITGGDFDPTFSNGTLTAGNGTDANGEVIFHTTPMTNTGITWLNAGDLLTFAGGVANGTPVIFNNVPAGLAAGTTYFVVNSAGNNFQVALIPGGAALAITADSAVATNTFAEFHTTTVTGTIDNNGAGIVGLTKTSNGILNLQGTSNTFTGKTSLNGGFLQVDADANLGLAPASPTVGHLTISGGSTLDVRNTMTLNSNRGLVVGPGSNVISIAAGTAGNGKTLTYAGTLSSIGEGSLSFVSNATTTNTDTGDAAFTISAPINLGGSLRLDAGTFSVPAGDNVIGRSLQVGLNGTGTFTQASGTLRVGAGINDTLDIGVSASDSVNKIGNLNLGGVTEFTANVDVVRVGVVTGGANATAQGNITFAANNEINARTSILVGDGPSAGLATQNLPFGTGTNILRTTTLTLGGRKATATVTLGAGGTLEITGFGQRTLTAFLGRQNVSTAGLNLSSINTTNGTLLGSFNTLEIGVKSGGGNGGSDATVTTGAASNLLEANTLTLGSISGADASGASTRGFGTLNFGGGTFTVFNNLVMGAYAGTLGTGKGSLNITGGTVVVGGNITKTDNDRSSAVITIAGGTLDLQNTAFGDTAPGTMAVSQLAFRSGGLNNVASITADGRGVTSGTVFAALDEAVIVRDVSISAPIALTNATANKGGIRYEAAGAGAGATLSGSIDLGSVPRTFNVEDSAGADADLTVSGAITGVVDLNKTGLGTLLLNNNVAGGVNVNAGTLGGFGSIAGAVTVASGATLAPGASAGQLDTGSFTLNAGSALSIEIGGLIAGSGYDQVNVTGAFTLGGALSASLINGFVPAANDTFVIGLNDNAGDDAVISTFNGLPQGSYVQISGYDFTIDYAFNGDGGSIGNDVALISIPEPTALISLLGGVGLLLGLRRRRA